ncbi:MAG: AmpG family muropeptide MFS transporter [Rickettsiales bacterium]|nr:AmpG family muropeptide MFS transporter [Rickettsiales bacterium]
MRPIIKPQLLLIGLLGFFSGLPLALTASTLTAWLADEKVARASIGLFAAIATPYALKFLWAPLLDGLRIPILTQRLGRRRSWLLITQLLLALSVAAMAATSPAVNPWMTALVGVIIATLSATQDTAIDAYRVERLTPEQQGSGAAWATFGYRIGMLVSGAGALYLADHVGWKMTYLVMAAVVASSLLITLLMREVIASHQSPVTSEHGTDSSQRHDPASLATGDRRLATFLRDYVVAPFRDFMTRPMWLQVLAFVILYKLGDAFMGVMFNPFLLDIGFTKTEIAQVVKIYGLIATILGTFAGGWLVGHAGMFRSLLLCGFMHMLTNLLLVMQAQIGADVHFLTFTISLENFTGGMSTAAFIAYLSALCRINYTATQYALLSSLAAFGRTWLSTPSGVLAQSVGWEMFFLISSLMSIPSLLLLIWLERKKRASPLQQPTLSL